MGKTNIKIDAVISIGEFFDVSQFSINIGEIFTLTANTKDKIKFLSDNDPVLLIDATENIAKIKATSTGTSSVYIWDRQMGVLREIIITVTELPSKDITSLNLTSNIPVIQP